MTKHSPAPFGSYATPSSDPYNIRIISDAGGYDIATVRYPAGMKQEEALANAALFKAAPKLLAALEEITERYALLDARLIAGQHNELNGTIERARAAIAEAKGEK